MKLYFNMIFGKGNFFLSVIFLATVIITTGFSGTVLAGPLDNNHNTDPYSDRKLTAAEIRKEISDFAKEFIGIKYRYNGTGPKGFDCSGFTSFVYSKFGMGLSHNSAAQSKDGMRVPISDAKPGDLLFFAVNGKIHHVGIVVRNTKSELLMIHSSTSRGVIIENVWTSAYWRKRLLFAKDVVTGNIFAENTVEINTF